MKIAVLIETGEADQGYEEGEEYTYEQHIDDIQELLRSGYYDVVQHAPDRNDTL